MRRADSPPSFFNKKLNIAKMKQQIATDPSQSARLIACGVDEASADMVWTTWENDNKRWIELNVMNEYAYEMGCLSPIPAWSLSALLTSVIPPKIIIGCGDEKYTLRPELLSRHDGWRFVFFAVHKADSPVECVVQGIEWLARNGYRLNP